MNKAYRTLWNHARQSYVVAAENTRTRGKAGGSVRTIAEAVAAAVIGMGAWSGAAASATVQPSASDSITIPGNNVYGVGFCDSVGLWTSGSGGTLNNPNGWSSQYSFNPNTYTFSPYEQVGNSLPGDPHLVYLNTGHSGTLSLGSTNLVPDSLLLDSVACATQTGYFTTVSGLGYVNTGSSVVSGSVASIVATTTANQAAVLVNAGHQAGSVVNYGSIYGSGQGLLVDGSSVSGSPVAGEPAIVHGGVANLNNTYGYASGFGTIVGGQTGIAVVHGGVVLGGIYNEGEIIGLNASGVAVTDHALLQGGLSNSGWIGGGVEGVLVANNSRVVGDIVNSGWIQGVDSKGIAIVSSSVTGAIVNQNGGSISGGTYGIGLSHSSVAAGVMNYDGSISGGIAGIGLSASHVNDGITNQGYGVVEGALYGVVLVDGSSVSQGINNFATLSGLSGGIAGGVTAIKIVGSSVTGGINNSGLVLTFGNPNLYYGLGGLGNALDGCGICLGGSVLTSNASGGASVDRVDNSGWVGLFPYIGYNNFNVNLGGNLVGVGLTSGSVISQGLTNTGVIDAGGIFFTGASVAGSITGIGVLVDAQSTIAGGIHNNYGGGLGPSAVTPLGGIGYMPGIWGATSGIEVDNGSSVSGGIANDNAVIFGASLNGIGVSDSSRVSGGVSNGPNGAIYGGVAGIAVTAYVPEFTAHGGMGSELGSVGGSVTGGIVNSGLVQGGDFGIVLGNNAYGTGPFAGTVGGYLSGGITNSGSIIGGFDIVGGTHDWGVGIAVMDASTVSGGIQNLGTGVGTPAPLVVAPQFLANQGLVVGRATGILVASGSTVSGGVYNSGTITGGDYGLLAMSHWCSSCGPVNGSTIVGGITNSGQIYGGKSGLGVWTGSLVTGGINNTGSIVGNSYAGIDIYGLSQVNGGIQNGVTGTVAGLIYGLETGIRVEYTSQLLGGINNAGTIIGAQIGFSGPANYGWGIRVESNSLLTGGITNSGLIDGGEGGIGVSNYSTVIGDINNTGTIHGYFRGLEVWDHSTIVGSVVNQGSIGGDYFYGVGVFTGSQVTGDIRNQGTLSVISGGEDGILIDTGSTVGGSIVNQGTIHGGGYVGIGVYAESRVVGDISNSGTLSVISGGEDGILIDTGSTVGGSIVNQGTIRGDSLVGIGVYAESRVVGDISNSGPLSVIAGGEYGIDVTGHSTVGGSILNQGTISGGSEDGISVYGRSRVVGDISNSGTLSLISGGRDGIQISSSAVGGSIVNEGTITGASRAGIGLYSTSLVAGDIRNSGTLSAISGGEFGIHLDTESTVGGGITNQGTITGGFVGVYVHDSSQVVGSVVNQGALSRISGGYTGLGVAGHSMIAGVLNQGTIQGLLANGIDVYGFSTVVGDINNQGTSSLVSGGVTGIVVGDYSTVGGNIFNQGTIIGLSGDGIQVYNHSTVGGDIANQGASSLISGGADGVELATNILVGGNITNEGTITGISYAGILVNSGSRIVGDIRNDGTLSVISGGQYGILVNNSSTIGGGIFNQGTITGAAGDGIDIDFNSRIGGDVTNAGALSLISGANYGLELSTASTIGGAIVNQGTIIGLGDAGIGVHSNSRVAGNISNQGTLSVISGATYGIILDAGASVGGSTIGGVFNQGTIAGLQYAGISVHSGSLIVGDVTNAGTLSMISGGQYGIVVDAGAGTVGGSAIGGGIFNQGTILGAADAGIAVHSASIIVGGIANQGVSSLISGGQYGIEINAGGTFAGSLVGGGILNQGQILGTGTVGTGIGIEYGSVLVGDVTNAGTMSVIGGGQDGIEVGHGSLITGSVVNQGVIEGQSYAGLDIAAGSLIAGDISNSGTLSQILGGVTGIRIDQQSGVGGSIVNDGVILGGVTVGAGIGVYANSSVTGGILNNSLILGGNYGIELGGLSPSVVTPDQPAGNLYVGGITNLGLVGGGLVGINGYYATIGGGIQNLGTHSVIAGGGSGIALSQSLLTGSIYNEGVIGGVTNSGISLYGSMLSGTLSGIANSGPNSLITGRTFGVYLSATTMTGAITNDGMIRGGVGQTSQAGIYVGTGSMVTAGITNSGTIQGSPYAVYVDATSTVPGLTITGNHAMLVGDVFAENTDVVIAGTTTAGAVFGNTNAFDVLSFTVQPGALFNFGAGPSSSESMPNGIRVGFDGTSATGTFWNAGSVSIVGSVTGQVTGNYVQTGTLTENIYDMSHYGKLAATGTATVGLAPGVVAPAGVGLSNNAQLVLNVIGTPQLTMSGTIAGVLTGSTVVGNFADAARVTSNVPGYLYYFQAVPRASGSAIDLVVHPGFSTVTDAAANGNGVGHGAAQVLDQIIAVYPTTYGPMNPVVEALGNLNGGSHNGLTVSDAVTQTLPLLTGATGQVSADVLADINRIVQSRIEGNAGMNSGDTFAGDKRMWLKPFGSWAKQNDDQGVAGYKANSSGLAMGFDLPMSQASRLGLAVAYANTSVTGNSAVAPQSAKIDMYQLIGYGSYDMDQATLLSYQLDVGYNTNKGTRNIAFYDVVASSSYNSQVVHAGIGLGRSYPLSGDATFTPTARIDYTLVDDKAYTETGAGPLNLNVDSRNTSALLFSLDGKFANKLSNNMTLVANVGGAWDSTAKRATLTSAFAGAPTLPFVTEGIKPNAFTGHGGVGVVSTIDGGLELTVRYDLEGRSGFTNQTVSAKLRWSF